MPAESGQTAALAANVDSGNVLAGKTYEFVPREWRRGAAIRVLGSTTAAAGVGAKCSVKINQTSVLDSGQISYAARFPVIPDDQIVVHWAPPGARLFVSFNGGAAGATVNWKVDVEPA